MTVREHLLAAFRKAKEEQRETKNVALTGQIKNVLAKHFNDADFQAIIRPDIKASSMTMKEWKPSNASPVIKKPQSRPAAVKREEPKKESKQQDPTKLAYTPEELLEMNDGEIVEALGGKVKQVKNYAKNLGLPLSMSIPNKYFIPKFREELENLIND